MEKQFCAPLSCEVVTETSEISSQSFSEPLRANVTYKGVSPLTSFLMSFP